MISAPSRQRLRATALTAAVALLMLPGLLATGASAEPAATTGIKPSALAVGGEPRPGWVSWAHGDQLDDELRRPGQSPISLAMSGATAQQVREAATGWLVDYIVWDRPLVAPHRLVLVRPDGRKRVLAQRSDQVQVVSADGTDYVTKREVFDRRHRRTATVLRSVRIADGHVTDQLRIAGPDLVRVRLMRAFVILDRVAPATRGGAHRVTTLRWRPASGRVATQWRRTEQSTDDLGIGKVGRQEIVLPDPRRRQGETVVDLPTHRTLWRIPVREHATRFGHGVLLTMTAKAGPEDTRTLRAREARTGRLLATYRGTILDSTVRWESSRRFVIGAADGLEPSGEPGGGGYVWANPSLVRCSIATAGCERVDADFTSSSISTEPGTPS